MRALVLDDEAKAKAQRVMDYALLSTHWFRPHKDAQIPGNDPRFVAHLDDGYRCVFTITEDREGKAWRHLSISVPGANYPNPFAAYSIAELFGFTGWDRHSFSPPEGWALHVDKDEHCIALGQEYKP